MEKLRKAQNLIPQTLKTKKNVAIDSVAGSGKTTSILKIGYEFPDKNILVLTYNSMLRKETQKRLEIKNMINIEPHTYHSFAHKHIQCSKNDEELYQAVYNKQLQKSFPYSYIVIDEAQDMNILYCMLIHKILKYSINDPIICVIGDKKQCIYGNLTNDLLVRSDSRFLTHAENIFTNGKNWEYLQLPYSYRVPSEISSFINNCMLNGKQRIHSVQNQGYLPHYIEIDAFNTNEMTQIYNYIVHLIEYKGYKPSDIFILDISVKNGNRPNRKLENMIVSNTNYKVFVPKDDSDGIDEKLIEDKIILCSYHQAKGRERKCAIVFSFDAFFPHNNLTECPNTLYVATTRASERLIVIRNINNSDLGFIQRDNIHTYCNVNGSSSDENLQEGKFKKFDCTTLVRHLDGPTIQKCLNELTITTKRSPEYELNIPGISNNEIVADVNGVAIPAMFEQRVKGEDFPLQNLLEETYEQQKDSMHSWLRKHVENALQLCNTNGGEINTNDALYITNVWMTLKRGYYNTLKQVGPHNWLTESVINQVAKRLKSIIHDRYVSFEQCKELKFDDQIKIKGYIDMIDNLCVYELKCVAEITYEHILQAVVYKWLANRKYCLLYNIKTNHLLMIDGNIQNVVQFLIENKQKENDPEINDESFFNMIHEEKKKIQ